MARSDDTDEILEALDMEFWADREGLAYKTGRGSSGYQMNFQCCPNCGDRRWRTYFGLETGRGNCFVCSEPFGKSKFINLALGLSWADTFKHIREVIAEQGWRPKRLTTVAVENGPVKLPHSFPLPTLDGRNLQYLENRGINADLARYFNMRYCTRGWWNFTKPDGSTGGQKFDARIILPVYDLDGTLKTFQGRDITGTADKKYLFPLELPGTGRFLYNAQNFVRAEEIVMGEGVFDVAATKIALDTQADLRDVVPVGTFGKHLSYGSLDGDDQLGRLLQLKGRGLKRVTIMWDGEAKALIAALDAAELMRKIGLLVRIALLPFDKDPNEVPAEVVVKAFREAVPYTTQQNLKWRLKNPYSGK